MKICFRNADDLLRGIGFLSTDLDFAIADEENADVIVTAEAVTNRALTVSLDGNQASIIYGEGKARFFRGLAMLIRWIRDGQCHKSVSETPTFKTNGAMLQETSAVMKVETVKTMFRKMAMMGMNACLFYTEDTYEIKERPYFGHMRGRYSHEELKELDGYALSLGIELIPCVQMLGHLASHLRWAAAAPYKDTSKALLVGADETYRLIDDMLKTISACFTTRRVHIGMDETHDLGTGKYLELNGYAERQDLYFAHLERVKKMAADYGLEPMMWSDMFFRLAGKGLPGYRDFDTRVVFTDEVIQKIPKGVRQVFWDYYIPDESFYATNIDKHRKVFGEDPLFAGGVWCWSGHCPLYSRSLGFTIPALDACRKKGVEEIFATVWGGSEHSLVLCLAGLAWYADYDYKGGYDPESVKECFRFSCGGVSYDDMMLCELPEHPDGGKLALTRALLYNDPLLGLADKHLENFPMQDYYRGVTKQLEAAAKDKGIFAAAYDPIVKLSSLLENKADFGVRLKAAYDRKDTQTLEEMMQECDVIIEKVKILRLSHRKAWMTYNKPFGWVTFDLRYGGLLTRFDTVKEQLRAYLDGEIQKIDELEEQRLRLDGQLGENVEPRFHSRFLWMGYNMYSNVIG